MVHYNLEHLDNADAAEKWKNALEFINFMIKNKKKRKNIDDPSSDQ